jgi:hypothetical protein
VYDDGGAHHNFEMELCGKGKEAGRPLWFKQVKPAMSPHQHHKRIVIEGELLDWEEQQPNANISVNFFHDALDWHPTSGSLFLHGFWLGGSQFLEWKCRKIV